MKKNKTIIALLILVVLALAAFIFTDNTYQGVYYPNGCLVCEDDYMFSPIFDTPESCMDWLVDLYIERGVYEDLYECGKNCNNENGLLVCDETFDAI